jgi:hypothetical protein
MESPTRGQVKKILEDLVRLHEGGAVHKDVRRRNLIFSTE